MLRLHQLGRRREQVFEVAIPPRRVFTIAILVNLVPIETRFDPVPHPTGGDGLLVPDRLDALKHQTGVDVGHRKLADLWQDIVSERVGELGAMLGVLPLTLMRLEILFGGLGECNRLGLFQAARCALFLLVFDGVDTVVKHLPKLAGLGRSPSTVSREIRRNGGCSACRASRADRYAWDRALRPKPCRLARDAGLRWRVAQKLALQWSPKQISGCRACNFRAAVSDRRAACAPDQRAS